MHSLSSWATNCRRWSRYHWRKCQAEKEKVGEEPKDVKKEKEKDMNELIEEEKKNKKEKEEKEKDEEKGFAIIDGIYY